MPYVMDLMTKEDWERVAADTRHNPVKYSWFEMDYTEEKIARHLGKTPWAVDRENDSYLFRGPRLMGGAQGNINYSFFYRGILYWIHLYQFRPPMREEKLVKFDIREDMQKLSSEALADLKVAVKRAFAAYGRDIHNNYHIKKEGKSVDQYPEYQVIFEEEV